MDINEDLVRRLSLLARIELSEEEVRYFLPQLKEILAYVEKINSLNLENISPSASAIDVFDVYHEDKARVFPGRDKILKISFLASDKSIVVPAVIEKNDSQTP